MTRTAGLRVGIGLRTLPLTQVPSGHGRVWHETTRRLGRLVDLALLDTRRWPVWSRRARQRPDVWLANGHGGANRVREPNVAILHEAGWHTDELRSVLTPEYYEMISAATRDAVASADMVVVPSSSARSEVLHLYDIAPSSVKVVPYGVDTEVFRPLDQAGRPWPSPVDGPYVLFAATVHPRKNLPVLRSAMRELAGRGLPHRLVIASGDSPDRSDSSALVEQAKSQLEGFPGRVVWIDGHPSDTELASLMAHAEAFCLPSLSEGFGLTALEAMACGTPVVVSDRGALPEVVGSAGLVVSPAPEALTAALESVLSNDAVAKRLRAAGPQRAREMTWERTAQGWLAVLEEAADIQRGTTRPRRLTASAGPDGQVEA